MPQHETNGNDFVRNLKFEPLTRRNRDKFVELFAERGACADGPDPIEYSMIGIPTEVGTGVFTTDYRDPNSKGAGFEVVDRTSKSRPTVIYSLMKNPRAKRQ